MMTLRQKSSLDDLLVLKADVETFLRIEDISVKDRRQHYIEARMMFFAIGYERNYTYTAMGEVLKRNHATAIHAVIKHNDYVEQDSHYRKTYYLLELELNEKYDNNDYLRDVIGLCSKLKKDRLKDIIEFITEPLEVIEKIEPRSDLKGLDELLYLNDSDILEFKETRLKPFLMMLETRNKAKQVQYVAGAMLNR